jgi:protein tyrosine phosphatase (PTP) superfamily phosphohydrolase (DUF442 family)
MSGSSERGDSGLGAIRNFRRLDDQVATAGMPTEEQLRAVAAAGVETVINLALPTSPGALPDEQAIVTSLGMDYVHIPVKFDAPAAGDFAAFCEAMETRRGQKLFVHCAANYRVSAFMALYRIRQLGWSSDAALAELREVWEPDEVWSRFITAQLG